MDKSEIGRKLQSYAKGVKKTMTPEALKQRREALVKANKARQCGNKNAAPTAAK